jgi:FixJ family two-component response regulator
MDKEANSDIPTSVNAMKSGAVDFLAKPIDGEKQVIAGRINKQIASDFGTGEKAIKVHRSRVMHQWNRVCRTA